VSERPEQQDLEEARAELARVNRELERVEQFNSFLLSMLAHDMRTPLAAIRGYSELLTRLLNSDRVEMVAGKATGFAENICHITDQMTWLIRDIIDLELAEKGLLEIRVESCDIHGVIGDTIEMMSSIIRLQNITVRLELNPPELLVAADPERMRQVTNNLIGNAVKFTPSGGQVLVSTLVENGEAVLVVADNGRGMTAEQLDKIFEPYYRTPQAKTSTILGSGLGMSIVKRLVEGQNGRVEVESEVGKGSMFTVYVPLAAG
jgi:signal transduction histidine kinase